MATIHPFPVPPEPATDPAPPPPGPHPWGEPKHLGHVDTVDAYTSLADPPPPVPAARQMPAWWGWSGLKTETARVAGDATWKAKWHAAYAHVHLLTLLRAAPRGWWLATKATHRWATCARHVPVIEAMTRAVHEDSRGTSHLAELSNQHHRRVRRRICVLVAALALIPLAWLVGLLIAGLAAGWFGVGAYLISSALSLIVGFGLAGRPRDGRPILDRAVSSDRPPPFDSELVTAALLSLGIGKMNTAGRKDASSIQFTAPIMRAGEGSSGGWRAEIQLPIGVTVSEVASRKEALASALRRPDGCIWPSQGRHPAHLILFVSDQELSELPPPTWPLAERGKANLMGEFPVGVDQQGRWVNATLAFVAWLVGAQPRMGKTAFLRLLGLAAALDETAELHLLNCKGGPDFQKLKPICHTYISSARSDSRPLMLADLKAIQRRMEDRYDLLDELAEKDPERCPEGKTTEALAQDRTLDLHPIVIIVDECHMAYFDAAVGKEIAAVSEDLARRGPAVLISQVAASQRLDKNSIPRGISTTAQMRFCLRVADHNEADMILGTAAHARGAAAETLSRHDVGIGYMTGETGDPDLVRTCYVDLLQAGPIVARALEARRASGRLTGMAAGVTETIDDDLGSVVDHVIEVWPLNQPKVHSDVLCSLLAERWPTMYGGWGPTELAVALGPSGIKSRQVNTFNVLANKTKNLQGYALEAFGEYLERRDAESNLDDELADLGDD